MPFPRDYTPRRRWIMTAVMWLIFAGTLGLAAVISRLPGDANVALSTAPVEVGDVSAALPEGWTVEREDIVFVRKRAVAVEPVNQENAARGGGRRVAVTVESAGEEFVSDLIQSELAAKRAVPSRHDNEFMIGPLRGEMMSGHRVGFGRKSRSDGVAVAIARIPNTEKIVAIELQSRELKLSDIVLLRRIAANVQIPAHKPGDRDDQR
jgi:hypothetical protein